MRRCGSAGGQSGGHGGGWARAARMFGRQESEFDARKISKGKTDSVLLVHRDVYEDTKAAPAA